MYSKYLFILHASTCKNEVTCESKCFVAAVGASGCVYLMWSFCKPRVMCQATDCGAFKLAPKWLLFFGEQDDEPVDFCGIMGYPFSPPAR